MGRERESKVHRRIIKTWLNLGENLVGVEKRGGKENSGEKGIHWRAVHSILASVKCQQQVRDRERHVKEIGD